MTLTIEWTDEARGRVRRRRREPGRPLSYDVDAAWATVRQSYRAVYKVVAPEVEPWLTSVRARLEQPTPPFDLSVDELAMLARLQHHQFDGVGRLLIGGLGLERAVEVWVRSTAIEVVYHGHPRGTELRIAPRPAPPASFGDALRDALLAADDATYAACRARVAPLFDELDVLGKAGVVDAFPAEVDWANTFAAEVAAAAAPTAVAHRLPILRALYGANASVEKVREAALVLGADLGDFDNLLEGHGEAAVGLLIELADRTKAPHEVERLVRTLSIVRSPDVAALIARQIGKGPVRKHAGAYFRRFPELAEAALQPVAAGKGRAATMAEELLAQSARAEQAAALVEAPLDALPAVLTAPPWAGGARPTRKPLVVKDAQVLDAPRAYHGPRARSQPHPSLRMMTPEEVVAWEATVDAYDPTRSRTGPPPLFFDHRAQRLVPPDARLRVWNEGRWRAFTPPHVIRDLFIDEGMDALPGFVCWARQLLSRVTHTYQLGPLVELEAPELAPEVALAFGRRPLRDFASAWFRRYDEAAIAGLVPAAIGEKSARRTAAERALRWLAAQGHEARIRARAAELGARASAAIDEVLTWDPLGDCPKSAPKLSARYRPEGLVRPLTKDGLALPLSAVRHLDEMLAFSLPDAPYAGLALVAEVCDARSLAEHAWSLARAWEASGARKSDAWMMRSLVHLADDEVVRRTTPALKNALVIDVLADIGTDAAAMELATIGARPGKLGQLRDLAEKALDRIAEARGIDRERLDEQLTPTLGLGPDGALELDYGPRSFRVVFDEHLAPAVLDEEGKRSAALPRARKDDDDAKVEQARQRWDELREDVSAIAVFRIQALERAMISGADWAVEDFEAAWAHHPLMMHLARRVVFAGRRPDGAQTFRVAEDGTYESCDHEPVTLEVGARVFVPHPLRWPDDTLGRWADTLADFRIIQPFPQLGRSLPRVSSEERAGPTVARTIEATSWYDQVFLRRRLTRCGWVSPPQGEPFLPLEGEWFVHLRVHSTAGPTPRVEHRVTLREGTEERPWTAVGEDVLLRVLDDLTP
ncbi:MAG: DUF4132 domain-containing protein [Myxococcales bacterium]|nr:DUF4132 domain-containing protein [Myxococcales bacterium]